MRAILPLVAAFAACAAPRPAPDPADLVFVGGVVRTMVEGAAPAEALAVRNRKIVAVGASAEVLALVGPDTETVDLEGRVLLPGFVESAGALLRRGPAGADAVEAASARAARRGVLTVLEDAATPAELELVTDVANELRLVADAIVFPDWSGIDAIGEELEDMDCIGSCRIGGLSFEAAVEGLDARVQRAFEEGWHLQVHVRSPGELARLVDAVAAASPSSPASASPRPRVVAVAVGELGVDRALLDRCAAEDVWLALGPDAVATAVACASRPGVRFTLHDAATGREPDPIASIARAVAAGLGREVAMAAWTREAAAAIRLEKRKGTLVAGKLADLVALDADPLEATTDLDAVRVVAAWKQGVRVLSADAMPR
ncbi:MAG: amidohydrolase family protein [Planctomycetota bacterium]|nr:amidohydrolase family protein [Planctomycetota bacterium]